MRIEKVILNVFLAATVGVVIGMLFAPEKGSRVRRNIKEKGEDYLEDIKDGYKHSISNLEDKAGAVYDKISS